MSGNNIQQILSDVFGFQTLRSGQQQVIEAILSGHSCAAIFPTGSGKSLCYQLPALALPHLTLVISPLIALMKDQLDFLQSKGIDAAVIEHNLEPRQLKEIMARVKNGTTKILMISVERLKNERFRQFIQQVPISLLVVDEAHCISEWGHNFRPDYLKLPNYRQALHIPQVLLLTATATPDVVQDMQRKFAITDEHVTITGFYRENLDLAVIPCQNDAKKMQLQALLTQQPELPTIVYVTLQHSADDIARYLSKQGIKAHAYHAGMKNDLRQQIQQDFMQDKIHCIVATIAFGMGVDKSNIRRVIHYDLPKSMENYAQEIGRAGRDGKPSLCSVLANKHGLSVLENFVYGDTPDKDAIRYVVDTIRAHAGEAWHISLYHLSRDSNIRQLALKTLLVYLEIEQVLSAQYSYYSDYRFKLIRPASDIIHTFQGERQQFVNAIFQHSPAARTWHQVDFDGLWQTQHAQHSRVVAALDYFHQQGWIELESKQMLEVYNISANLPDCDALTDKLYQLFKTKEDNEIKRIHKLLDFLESPACLSRQLALYFNDQNAPLQCGHCSVCRQQIAKLPAPHYAPLDDFPLQQWLSELQQSAGKHHLSDASCARFLCGITTPLLTQIKAAKLSGFARLTEQPFTAVLEAVQRIRKS